MSNFSLEGDVAFVTGAGSGIGQAIAIGMADAGAAVACFDLPGAAGLNETVGAIVARGRRGLAIEGNVTNASDLAHAVSFTEQQLGPLTVAVNSAGIASNVPAEEMEEAVWERIIGVNLTGVFLSCQAEARVMLERKRGVIVNIASMSGTIVNKGLDQIHYNTSKAGVIHLTKSLAVEWASHGIRVNALSPGYTRTPMNTRPEEEIAMFAGETPMSRLASVEEIVGPAIFLASKASSFITAHDLIVDGGYTAW